MHELPYEENPQWKDILEALSRIRSEDDYSPGSVDFIRENLGAFDDRIRGAAALAAGGCIFEPYVLDAVISIAEDDGNIAIRKAALQSLGAVIHEAVVQGMADPGGADTALDDAEEWEELQSGSLRDDYLRVRQLLFDLLEDDGDWQMQELALSGLADLGFLSEVRQKISEFYHRPQKSSRLIALHAMGRYPQYWEDELAALIRPDADTALLKEAISACYSSDSPQLAKAITGVLNHADSEVLRFAIMTLVNINKTPELPDLLQQFSVHENSAIQEAAREGIDIYTRRRFSDYVRDDLGMQD